MFAGWRRRLLVGVVALCCVPGVAWASEVDVLLNKLVEKGLLTAVEAQEVRNDLGGEAKQREDAQKNLVKGTVKEMFPESSRNWKWGGDLRLRNESRNRTGGGQDVNRQRIRFRYGFNAKVTDHLNVGARLATGSTTDPVSTNQTLDQSFNHNTVVLDRAFAEYTPEIAGITEVKLSGGKIENPFWLVGPLVWDDDVNVDGAAVHLAEGLGPMATVFTNDGIFLLQSGITEAASLWSTQAGMVFKPGADSQEELFKNLRLTAAIAYHDYKNVTNPLSESTALTTAGGLKGNTSGIRDLNLFNPTFELASQYRDVPFGVFGDWVHNTAVAQGKNGVQIGLRAGKARVPFDLLKGWEGGYFFERLEPDATFGALTDSDFGNGGTNHRGHVWWVKLATVKNSSIQLKYLTTHTVKGAKNHADTFQADWVTKF